MDTVPTHTHNGFYEKNKFFLLGEMNRNIFSNTHMRPSLPESPVEPRVAKAVEEERKVSSSQSFEGCNCDEQILIVDDNSFNLIPLELILETNFGLKCDQATNGLIAYEKVKENLKKKCCNQNYKLILMDLNMPVMDGFESTEKILEFARRVGSGGQIKVVAVTAYVNEEFVSRCYEVGMVDVLHKPVSKDELKRVLKAYFYQ